MSSHSKDLTAVFGATEQQGGGLGDELVEADLDRPETLKDALEGAHSVFQMRFWPENGLNFGSGI